MNAFLNFIKLTSFPIILMNMGAGLIGGIWLLFKGEWKLLLGCLLIAVILKFVLSFLLLISIPLALGVEYFRSRAKFMSYILGYLNLLWTNLLILSTCGASYNYFIARHQQTISESSIIPYLLMAWVMGLGVWQYFASQEDNIGSLMTLHSASVFYLVCIMAGLTQNPIFILMSILLFIFVHIFILPFIQLYFFSQAMADEAEA